jgi:hypothetical protein
MPATHQDTPAVHRLKPVVRAVVAGYLAVALIGALHLAIRVQLTGNEGRQEYAVAENYGVSAGDRLLP